MMEPENNQIQDNQIQDETVSSLHKVTPFSRYLALALFVTMPFIGGWIGYTYAPDKVVEVERIVLVENNKSDSNTGIPSGVTSEKLKASESKLCTPILHSEFIVGEQFEDKYTSLKYFVPEGTQSIIVLKDCPHTPRAGLEPYRTDISFNDSTSIRISHNAYFGEWTGGVPVTEVGSSTVQIDSGTINLLIYDTYKWDEENGYGDWETEGLPFAVVFIRDGQSEDPHTMINLPYTTVEQKNITEAFLGSIEFLD